jgi:signal peptidase II
VALGLQLGGALGNLIDRFRQGGHVTDFIDVGPVPVFNIADASIVIGVILLLFLMLMDERKEKASVESPEQPPALAENTSGESPEDQPMLWNE